MVTPICWAGAGDHEGHVITPTDAWAPHLTMTEYGWTRTCGRVRCSCGAEWNVGGWPAEYFDALDMTKGDPWCVCHDVDDPSHVHVHPLRDQIAHSLDEDCVCGPTAELVRTNDGGDGYVITHHSLDGREANE